MQRHEAIDMITEALREFVEVPQSEPVNESTRLVGGSALLDSAAVVSLIVEIEQRVDDQYGVAITIADERALSQERSPFRTVGTLADYVVRLCAETMGTSRA
jgi:acyl carrier protein